MALFTWNPDANVGPDHEPRIREAKFGDGYSQRAQDGLNADMETLPLSFTGRVKSEIVAIDAFLQNKGAVTSFTFVSPLDGVTKSYICKKWSPRVNSSPVASLTCVFSQVPL